MKVHLIGSMRYFDDDLIIMRKIVNVLESNNSSILLNWFESAHDRKQRGSDTELSWEEIVESNYKAALQADALIVEGSRFNYSQGFQTSLALEHSKPVLNLYRKNLPEYKEWPDKYFVSGISHPLFESKAYRNIEDLTEIVEKFIKKHEKKIHKLDLSISLDDDAYQYLKQQAGRQSKTESGFVRDLISRELKDLGH